MAKPKSPTVKSLKAHGEFEAMDVETAHRWSCSCGEKGPWVLRSTRAMQLGGRDRSSVAPSEMTRMLKDWQKHMRQAHPEADLSFDEWGDPS